MRLVALAISLTGCSGSAEQPAEVIRRDINNGNPSHLNVDVDLAGRAALDVIADESRAAIRRALTMPRVETIGLGFWTVTADGREPLASLDFTRAGVKAMPNDASAAEVLNAARDAHGRAPKGDLLLKEECDSSSPNLQATNLCRSVEPR